MPAKLNSVITRTVRVRGEKGKRECSVLFDTGASSSFVSRELAELIGIIAPLEKSLAFTIADGSQIQAREGVTLRFNLNGRVIEDDFIINPSPGFGVDEIILGMSTMEQFGIQVDPKHHDIIFSLKSASSPGAHSQTKGVVDMNEILKRVLARLGMTDLAPELTDEDAMSMIIDRCNRGYKAVAVPAVLNALALTEKATEAEATAAIETLKAAKKVDVTTTPEPSVTFAGVFAKLGITPSADLTEEKAADLIVAQVKKPAPATAVASKGVLSVLELADTSTEEEIVGRILALKNPGFVVTVEQHANLKEELRANKLEMVIKSAQRAGKMYPAEEPMWRETVAKLDTAGMDGIKVLETTMADRPKLMPIGERPPVKTASDSTLDAGMLDVAKQLGVSAETLKKYEHAQ